MGASVMLFPGLGVAGLYPLLQQRHASKRLPGRSTVRAASLGAPLRLCCLIRRDLWRVSFGGLWRAFVYRERICCWYYCSGRVGNHSLIGGINAAPYNRDRIYAAITILSTLFYCSGPSAIKIPVVSVICTNPYCANSWSSRVRSISPLLINALWFCYTGEDNAHWLDFGNSEITFKVPQLNLRRTSKPAT